MDFYDIISRIDECIEQYGGDIPNEEIETILRIRFPAHEVYYSDQCDDLLSGIRDDIIRHKLIFDDLLYEYIPQLDIYFMIQKTHEQKGENE